jgi:hypothetical protein
MKVGQERPVSGSTPTNTTHQPSSVYITTLLGTASARVAEQQLAQPANKQTLLAPTEPTHSLGQIFMLEVQNARGEAKELKPDYRRSARATSLPTVPRQLPLRRNTSRTQTNHLTCWQSQSSPRRSRLVVQRCRGEYLLTRNRTTRLAGKLFLYAQGNLPKGH